MASLLDVLAAWAVSARFSLKDGHPQNLVAWILAVQRAIRSPWPVLRNAAKALRTFDVRVAHESF
jgi:hypothetical protein